MTIGARRRPPIASRAEVTAPRRLRARGSPGRPPVAPGHVTESAAQTQDTGPDVSDEGIAASAERAADNDYISDNGNVDLAHGDNILTH